MKKEKQEKLQRQKENLEKATGFREFWLQQWLFGKLKIKFVQKRNRLKMAVNMHENRLKLKAVKIWAVEVDSAKKN